MSQEPILPLTQARVFFDATLGPVRLKHPEGLAVAADGAVWCGGDGGEIYRIAADGSAIAQIATTGGFSLGMAFDPTGFLYTCDLGHRALFRLDPATGQLIRFADGQPAGEMRIPNVVVVDSRRKVLYVSDSFAPDQPGPGIWRVDLATGAAELWFGQPLRFANGLALEPGGAALYVVESFAQRVVRIPIRDDGAAAAATPFAEGLERVPDGLAFDAAGWLYVSCYEPSRLYRVEPDGTVALLIEDPEAHLLCHPTNCAFRGTELLTANLGRWHLTAIDVGVAGAPLLP